MDLPLGKTNLKDHNLYGSCIPFFCWFKLVGLCPYSLLRTPSYITKTSRTCHILGKLATIWWWTWSVFMLTCLTFVTVIEGIFLVSSLSRKDPMTEALMKAFMFQWLLIALIICFFFIIKGRSLQKRIRSFWDTTGQQLLCDWPFICGQSTLRILFFIGLPVAIGVSIGWYLSMMPVLVKSAGNAREFLINQYVKPNREWFDNCTVGSGNGTSETPAAQLLYECLESFGMSPHLMNVFELWESTAAYVISGTMATALIFAQIFLILLTIPIAGSFHKLTKSLRDIAESVKDISVEKLQELTKKHLNLTLTVRSLDEVFGPLLLLWLISDLFVLVAVVGVLRKGKAAIMQVDDEDSIRLRDFVPSVCLTLILLMFRIGSAVLVGEKAGEFNDTFVILFETRCLETSTSEQREKCQLQISRMGSIRAEFSAYGMFYINRSVAVTIVGVLLTYITLIGEMDKK